MSSRTDGHSTHPSTGVDDLAARRAARAAERATLTCPDCGCTRWRTEWVRLADPDGQGYTVVGHEAPVWCVDCGGECAVPEFRHE